LTLAKVLQNAATGTGNGSTISVRDMASLAMQVTGTFVATVTFEATVDDTNYVSIEVVNVASGTKSTTTTAAGVFRCSVVGLSQVRARVTWTSGTSVTVKALASTASLAPMQDAGTNDGVDIGNVDVATINSVAPQFDTTDRMAVSVYGKSSAAGDKELLLDSAGHTQADVLTLPSPISGPGNPTIDSYNTAAVNCAAAANQVLVAAPGAGKAIWVNALFMMADTSAGTVTLQDEDDLALSGVMAVSDEGGWVLPPSGNFAMPWLKCTTAKALEADCSGSTIDGIICYCVVTV